MKTRTAYKLAGALTLLLTLLAASPQGASAGVVPPVPTGPLDALGRPAVPDYNTTANWANSPPLAKFVDTLPKLGSTGANNLGQYLSVGKPDTTSYPGSDYYEIELIQYRQRLHSDLPPDGTLLRGYVQVNKGTDLSPGTLPSQNLCGADRHPCTAADNTLVPDPVRYLGPTLVTERDRPVRIKFTNKLPAGTGGDLFIPTDTTVMGAGQGPAYPSAVRGQGAPCDNTMPMDQGCASYPQNRADLHLHGGRTPWISDGTPHQWITPVAEITPFAKGASLQNVPDMPDPGDGSATYYYSNEQSARLMFYHDHAFGITRLNVYAGEAAGYLITDKWEQDLVARGLIPPDQIPLIIQDKTFVDATPTPHPASGELTPKVRITDPLWNWGSGPVSGGVREPVTGDLWLPHVYMPAQSKVPGLAGVNPFGRWMYGPWFYPATVIEKGPVPNPYYDQDCSSPIQSVFAKCSTPGQPPEIPGTPHPSMGMEAFQDTVVVNGTAFPTLTVDPRAYRFRILNAASDRFWNLSFYQADPTVTSPDPRLSGAGRSNQTEVRMVPASASLAQANNWPPLWPVDGREGGVPDPAFKGPSFLQIGTEGGFLPQPVTVEPQPITYITDPTAFWVGNVDKMGLALGPAERADVIVDFSAYAGKTLILYNDAPAAWPAGVANYDYYTGAPDMRDTGGFGTGGTYNKSLGIWEGGSGPLPGYAPNTRTVMQVIVRPNTGGDQPYSFDPTALSREFTAEAAPTEINPAPVKTLFERAQDPIIVGQQAYSDSYPGSYFPPNFPWQGINQINDHYLQFVTLAGEPVIAPTEPKGIHDEMGASFDPVYGRMSGNLGMQIPNPTTLTANLILYGFSDLPSETIKNSTQFNVSVVPGSTTLADGTQIWKISHNGVDTHPIHFHIFDVQLINRVGWDGQILMPEPNELGWKDTVKISPLEDTIVAVRPRAPLLPFGIPNSQRLLNPTIPLGSTMGFNSVDWRTGNATNPPVSNILYDFGWEYVWHCHILSHEEMDMMRPIVLLVENNTPPRPTGLAGGFAEGGQVTLTWNDPTPVDYTSHAGFGNSQGEIGFRIERCAGVNCSDFAPTGAARANATSYTETALSSAHYSYRVVAYNAAGDSAPSDPLPLANFGVVDGVCGAMNGQYLGAIPDTGLCSAGSQTVVSDASGVLTWQCQGLNNGTTASCTAYMPSYQLFFGATAGGSLTGVTSQTVIYSHDASTVTAVPSTGYHLVNWTEGGTVVSTSAALTATNVTAAHGYTANFAIDTFTLDFAAGPNGSISGTASQVVNYGADGTTVTAAAALPGYHFVSWTEGGTVVSTSPTLTVTGVTASHSYLANFAIDTFVVNFSAAANGTLSSGTGTGQPALNLVLNYGASAPLVSAVADPNYHFVNWTEGGTVVSTVPDLAITGVTANHDYTANFALTTYAATLDRCVSGPTVIASGSTPTYDFVTNGYSVAPQVNGVPVTLAGSSYTFPAGVTADQAITASYTVNPVGTSAPARIVRGTTVLSFATLQAAYDAAASGESIMLKGGTLTGNLLANRNIAVKIVGGYEASYTSNCSLTRIGIVTQRQGTVRVERVRF